MNADRIVCFLTAASFVAVASAASGQPASTPRAEMKNLPAAQGFSVVLVLGDSQSGVSSDNVPPAARTALNDMKDFLPYKGYRLLDAQWILGSQHSTSRLRGADDAEYKLTLRGTPVAGRMHVVFQLQEPVTEARAREGATDMRMRLEPFLALQARSVIDTSFNMDIGETVVVGTSRVRGGDKALIALLTAVAKGNPKRE